MSVFTARNRECAAIHFSFGALHNVVHAVALLFEWRKRTMNFLIVEDNQNMRRVMKSVVAEFAGETHECADGAEAFAAYAAHLPDCVLMDIRMRKMDGISATKQIKATYPKANIIIVTEYDDTELRRSARDAGASDYVVKENLLDVCRIIRGYARAGQSV